MFDIEPLLEYISLLYSDYKYVTLIAYNGYIYDIIVDDKDYRVYSSLNEMNEELDSDLELDHFEDLYEEDDKILSKFFSQILIE